MQARRFILPLIAALLSLLTLRSLLPAQPAAPLIGLAAASLAAALPAAAATSSATAVQWSTGGSGKLARQLAQGAPADLFVSAAPEWIAQGEQEGWLVRGSGRALLTNRLVLIVPREAAWSPAELSDLKHMPAGARIALGGPAVPAGQYARQALANAQITLPPAQVAEADDVRRALAWVASGEVEAAIVYSTDAAAQPRVRVAATIPAALHEPIRYEAAIVASSQRKDEAARLLDALASPAAGAIFEAAGFTHIPDAPALRGARSAGALELDPWQALARSLLVAGLVALLGLPIATGLGWLLARRDFAGKALVSTLIMAPMVLPPVVTGYLLLRLLGQRSPLGGLLAACGMPIPFHMAGAVLAALVVALPLYTMSARAAFERTPRELEESAWIEGATPLQALWHVAIPLARPGLLAGAVLAFMRALGEFGATAMLAGNIEGQTRTLSLAIYTALDLPGGEDAATPLIAASLALSLVALAGYERLNRPRWEQPAARPGS
jgi:molybdate transport system permease protein